LKIKKTLHLLHRPTFKINCRSSFVFRTWYLLLFFLLNILSSYSQDKQTPQINKSKKVEIISGIKYILHTVEQGQTLYAIAKVYERNLSDIVIDNPTVIDGIKPGQVLKISTEKHKKIILSPISESANIAGVKLHKVEQGQTLYALSKLYGTSVEKLVELNPELKEGLKIGQTLKVSEAELKAHKTTDLKPVISIIETKHPSSKEVISPQPKILQDSKAKENVALGTSTKTELSPPISEIEKSIMYSGSKKDQYKIAFFLPFHAEEANAIEQEKLIKGEEQLPNKTSVALQFYEGALLAIDSLKKLKFNANVFVYDIDDSDSLNMLTLLKKRELAEMDLIIGPLYGSSFMPISKFAKEHKIPIISPFTQINKILFDNPFVCKIVPSNTLQVEQLAHFVVDSFHTQNIILINNGNAKEVTFYNSFKNTSKLAMLDKKHSASDTVKEAKNFPVMQGLLSSSKTNVIILPSNSQSYVTEFISRLSSLQDKNKIVLLGLQNWTNYDNLDFEYLNGLELHIPSSNNIDFQNNATKFFVNNYREKYKTEPELYSYNGFDITYCFLSALQKYGSGFLNNIKDINYKGIASNFNFIQSISNKSGFENKFVVILKYDKYKLVKAN
jgi:ABC-type branched-subunit amino acid transport system substrate-binding protein/LysM repeat protein